MPFHKRQWPTNFRFSDLCQSACFLSGTTTTLTPLKLVSVTEARRSYPRHWQLPPLVNLPYVTSTLLLSFASLYFLAEHLPLPCLSATSVSLLLLFLASAALLFLLCLLWLRERAVEKRLIVMCDSGQDVIQERECVSEAGKVARVCVCRRLGRWRAGL